MELLNKISTATLGVGAGAISTIGWITLDGAPALLISIRSGSLIVRKATLGDADDKHA